jgi:hypothetical protein
MSLGRLAAGSLVAAMQVAFAHHMADCVAGRWRLQAGGGCRQVAVAWCPATVMQCITHVHMAHIVIMYLLDAPHVFRTHPLILSAAGLDNKPLSWCNMPVVSSADQHP